MSIKIQNLRISPYCQKDTLKAVFGDTMELTFKIPHVEGESFMCGLDNERVVYPPSRPICAYTNTYTRDGDDVTFRLKLTTSKLRDYVSSIRKPMPVWLQVVRVVSGKYETVLLDDILALPSVIDGAMTVCEGDPLKELLEDKMDKPAEEGTTGQVLTMGEDGHYVWTTIEVPEQARANWDESDSASPSYIENKPELATVATSGSYNDLSDKPVIPQPVPQVQANWDESDSSEVSYIQNKPEIPIVNDATVTINQGGTLKGTFTLNQSGDTTIDLNDGAQSDWDESDSSEVSYIRNKPTIPEQVQADWEESDSSDVSFIQNKPHIPADQVQADWNESDSSEVSYIQNKPTIPTVNDATVTINQGNVLKGTFTLNQSGNATIDLNDGAQADWDESDSSEVSYIRNKPSLDFAKNYFTVTSKQADSTIKMMTMQDVIPDIEYSTDGGSTWTQLVFTQSELSESLYFSQTITLANNAKALFRGNNHTIGDGWSGVSRFLFTGQVAVGGKLMSLLDKSCASDTMPNDYNRGVFASLFSCINWSDVTFEDNMYALVDASELVFPINSYNNAYMYTFRDCKGLTKVPNCFYQGANVSNGLRSTFEDSGITGKVVLGLTGQLANGVYTGMFEGCTGITKAEILNCIPARYSFLDTFAGCTNLTEITVHFTEWNNSWQWMNPPATGVWRCPKALDTTVRGMNGIPNGWTIEYIDEQPVQADWDESDSTDLSYIQNKPVIPQPVPQEQADWDESDSSDVAYIKNKPSLPDFTAIEKKLDDYNAMLRKHVLTSTPLCIEAVGGQVSGVGIFRSTQDYAFQLEYSWDNVTWAPLEWDGNFAKYRDANNSLQSIVIAVQPNQWFPYNKVYLRGDNPSLYMTAYNNCALRIVDVNNGGDTIQIKASGNVMSLIYKTGYQNATVAPANFSQGLFISYPYLVDASELILPATTLGANAYNGMFYNCQNLVKAPELPATTLGNGCYAYMFNTCVNLTEVKVAFTSWGTDNNQYTASWMENAGGYVDHPVFKCPSGLDANNIGNNGIPSHWTVERI